MSTKHTIEAALAASVPATRFHTVHHFTSIASTNTFAVEQAHVGAPSGNVYLADLQTAGRGRGGHRWDARAGDGLLISALVRPRLRIDDTLKISLAAGLAAQTAIREVTSQEIDLRWPNDLILSENGIDKKIGGILTEAATSPAGDLNFAVIGIGINLNQSEMPPELADISTSLRIVTGLNVSRDALAIALLRALSKELDALEAKPIDVLQRFEHASSWPLGKRVTVNEDGGYTGTTNGLSATGLLRILLPDGSIKEVRHGGVRQAMEHDATRN